VDIHSRPPTVDFSVPARKFVANVHPEGSRIDNILPYSRTAYVRAPLSEQLRIDQQQLVTRQANSL
jgi:hypothetical protein